MIGVINNTKIFEFRDEAELAYALSWFGDKYGAEYIIITDTADKIKSAIYNGDFLFGQSLTDETKYYIYGSAKKLESFDDMQKNTELSKLGRVDWQVGPYSFIYMAQKLPKELDI